jgi:Protein of unknown function (DUF2510)
VQQTTVIQVGSRKSVVAAVLLALFFGPLGMLYATLVGALVMFAINIVVVVVTLGLGLLITVPIGAVWAGIAASSHNDQLGAMSAHAVTGAPFATTTVHSPVAPAAWHDDPDGSNRLRYWDGRRWTEHFADKPELAGEKETQVLEPAPAEPAPSLEEAVTTVEEPQQAAAAGYCEACGNGLGADDRFCAACGASQTTAN